MQVMSEPATRGRERERNRERERERQRERQRERDRDRERDRERERERQRKYAQDKSDRESLQVKFLLEFSDKNVYYQITYL